MKSHLFCSALFLIGIVVCRAYGKGTEAQDILQNGHEDTAADEIETAIAPAIETFSKAARKFSHAIKVMLNGDDESEESINVIKFKGNRNMDIPRDLFEEVMLNGDDESEESSNVIKFKGNRNLDIPRDLFEDVC